MRRLSTARAHARLLPASLLPVLLATCLLAGCAGSATAGAAPNQTPVATTKVEMAKSYRFDPAVISVPVGATVTWHNDDNFTHSVFVQDGSGRNPIVRPGETATLTFEKAGEVTYTCSFHPQNMKGSVTVTG